MQRDSWVRTALGCGGLRAPGLLKGLRAARKDSSEPLRAVLAAWVAGAGSNSGSSMQAADVVAVAAAGAQTDGRAGCGWCKGTRKQQAQGLQLCISCEAVPPKTQRCAGCELAHYCLKECRTNDWKVHKVLCKKLQAAAQKGDGT